MNLNYQWERPLIDRARETLKAERRLAALQAATPEQLREYAQLLGSAQERQRRADQYAEHVAALPCPRPTHYHSLASIRKQSADCLDRVAGFFPDPLAEEEVQRAADQFAQWWLALPVGAQTVPEPTDGRGVPEGLVFLGETKSGRAVFTDSDRRLLVRNQAGELAGLSSTLRLADLLKRVAV